MKTDFYKRMTKTIERLAKMEQKVEDIDAKIDTNHSRVLEKLAELNVKLDQQNKNFVTMHEFIPVRRIVYGVVGTVAGVIITAGTAKMFGLW